MDNWKEAFYERYSTIFGKQLSATSYAQFIPYGRYIIRTCLPADKEARILDIGCGIGGFIKVFLDAGYTNVEGVDVSVEEVEFAHKHGIQQVKLEDLFSKLQKTADQAYDVVLFLDVLEHFRHHEVLEILSEAERVLAPHGRLIIHVPNAEGIFASRVRYSDFTHELAFTEKSLLQVCRYAGFSSFECFEDRPIVHTVASFFRRVIWEVGTLSFRILHAAETGSFSVKLTQNILFKAVKAPKSKTS